MSPLLLYSELFVHKLGALSASLCRAGRAREMSGAPFVCGALPESGSFIVQQKWGWKPTVSVAMFHVKLNRVTQRHRFAITTSQTFLFSTLP